MLLCSPVGKYNKLVAITLLAMVGALVGAVVNTSMEAKVGPAIALR